MIFTRTKKFIKEYRRLPLHIRLKFETRLKIFVESPFDPTFSRHGRHREYSGFESININADYRAIFKQITPKHYEFNRIGTHSKLYKK